MVVKKIFDIIANLIIVVCALFLLYLAGLILVFDTFHVPSFSMTPTINQHDRGVINKMKLGARIFDIMAAARGDSFTVRRLPGYGRLERGDIIVFNGPFIEDWDSVAMNMRRYYCKRAVGVAGDTVRIVDGFYRVNGSTEVIGVEREQEILGRYEEDFRRWNHDTVPLPGWIKALPFDSIPGWRIDNMGPMVVPAEGMTMALDSLSYRIYRKYIAWETGRPLRWRDGSAWIGDCRADSYTFKENYCFAGGDHVIDSQDSRYWGLVPEKYIVGVVSFLFYSMYGSDPWLSNN